MKNKFQFIYDRLFHYYGPQGWWPAETSFEMMIGAILVQNTSWLNVDKALKNLSPFLKPERMDELSLEKLAQLIKPSGFFNIKAKRIKSFLAWFKEHQFNTVKVKEGDKQKLREELLTINGIGRETADVMLLYAFETPVFVADAYAKRIFYRIGYNMPDSYDKFKQTIEAELPKDLELYKEFHALLVQHAKQYCRSGPMCDNCPLALICAQRR